MTAASHIETAAQIAALPLRRDGSGTFWVLMVTSRETGRWVLPKGWRIDGRKPWEVAEIEALQEAGAVGRIGRTALGHYDYDKRLADGSIVRCRVEVFPMLVDSLRRNWKERHERRRRWFKLRKAARRVDEPDLAALLQSLAGAAHRQPAIRTLLRAP